jgi:spore coat protein CotH
MQELFANRAPAPVPVCRPGSRLETSFLLALSWVILGWAFGASGAEAKPGDISLDFTPNLPVIFLRAEKPIGSSEKTPCTLQVLCPAKSETCITNTLGGVVRIHGASSQGYPKKSFAITLDAPAKLLDLRQGKHWILNAAYVDRSLMRHKLSYDLFRSLSTEDSPRRAVSSRFMEVFVNGSYNGAYLLMERVDGNLLGLQPFRSNEVNHACIYKAVDHAANFAQPGHPGYEQREPDPLVQPFWAPLDRLNRFVSTAKEEDFFGPEKGISVRMDLGNTIDFHLLVLLTSNMDGIDKNFIIARDVAKTNGPLPKFFFVPWDYDATFGRNWNAARVEPSTWLSNHLFERLQKSPEYRGRFAARWKQLRDHQFSAKTIYGLIDQNAHTLGEAVRRNAHKWPTTQGAYPDSLTFDQDVAEMKTWVSQRIQWLDQEIARRQNQ